MAIAEGKQALVQQHRQARDALLKAIDGPTDEQLTEPSLDGWSVKDHLAEILQERRVVVNSR